MTDDQTPKTDPDPDDPTQAARSAWGAQHAAPAPAEGSAGASAAAETAPAAPPSIYTSLDGSPFVPPREPASFGATAGPTTTVPAAASGDAVAAGVTSGGRQVFVLAGWGPRFLAFIVDGLLFGGIALVAAIAAGVALGLTVEESALFFSGRAELPSSVQSEGPFAGVLLGQVALQVGLVVWAIWEGKGQTPGKKLMRIRVVPADGSAFSFKLAFKREAMVKTLPLLLCGALAAVIPGFILLAVLIFLANYLWPLWDDQRQAIHDMIAETRVVKVPREAPAAHHDPEEPRRL